MRISPSFLTKIEMWTPLRAHYHALFSDVEVEALSRALRAYSDWRRNIVICAFENTYASLGGLSAVTKYFTRHLHASGERVIFISPFYKNISSVKLAFAEGAIRKIFSFQAGGFGSIIKECSCYKQQDGDVDSFYIGCDGFFEAGRHPYDYLDQKFLLNDALIFACMLPFVLQKLGLHENVLIHANDWETAGAALSIKLALIKGVLASAKTVLTLHNSYDCAIPDETLKRFFGRSSFNASMLQMSIPLLDAPLTTVSEFFARELQHDPLQTSIFTPHLQRVFSMNPPIGIENGTFHSPSSYFTEESINRAARGKPALLHRNKRKMRCELIGLLAGTKNKSIYGQLSFANNNSRVPIFFLSGRFDMIQKGFDVVFYAFRRLPRGSAKLIFSPSNCPDEFNASVVFFKKCVDECAGDITIWPFYIPRQQYRYFLSGSSFLLMPSFYEPFGAATEGFSNATPVIARATGGLCAQINSAVSYSKPPFHGDFFSSLKSEDGSANGILYREQNMADSSHQEWRRIFAEPVEKRIESPLYWSMVNECYKALTESAVLFNDHNRYYNLIVNGYHALQQFNWESVVEKYKRVYNCTTRSIL